MQGNNKILADKPSPTIRAEHHGNIEAHYRTTLNDIDDVAGWRRLSGECKIKCVSSKRLLHTLF